MGEDTTQQINDNVNELSETTDIAVIQTEEDNKPKVEDTTTLQNQDVNQENQDVFDLAMWEDLKQKLHAKNNKATPERLELIKNAARFGCTDKEIALYAEIDKQTIYNWERDFPLLKVLIDQWKDTPLLKARQTIIKNLDKDENAKWYLERKTKGEFANQNRNYNTDVVIELLSEAEKSNLQEMLGLQ